MVTAMTRSIPTAWIAVFMMTMAATASAGNGVWSSNGPDGGIVYEVRFDPNVVTTMYAMIIMLLLILLLLKYAMQE